MLASLPRININECDWGFSLGNLDFQLSSSFHFLVISGIARYRFISTSGPAPSFSLLPTPPAAKWRLIANLPCSTGGSLSQGRPLLGDGDCISDVAAARLADYSALTCKTLLIAAFLKMEAKATRFQIHFGDSPLKAFEGFTARKTCRVF